MSIDWKGPCSRCEKQFEANGLFAVQFSRGEVPPLCVECQGVAALGKLKLLHQAYAGVGVCLYCKTPIDDWKPMQECHARKAP